MLLLKGCKRCGGDIAHVNYGVQCLQCGRDPEVNYDQPAGNYTSRHSLYTKRGFTRKPYLNIDAMHRLSI